jgi:putative FmdB family regulatory protein
MPLYTYICDDCRDRTEEFRSIANRNKPLYCCKCEGKMQPLFEAPKALRTDTEFQRGIHFNDGMKNDRERNRAKALATKMGVNIEGKRYDGRLARFPMDPMAFYGDRSEARSAAARMGLASEDLGVKGVLIDDADKPYRVADDIVAKQAKQKVIKEHGGTVSRKKWDNIKQEVREQITPVMK